MPALTSPSAATGSSANVPVFSAAAARHYAAAWAAMRECRARTLGASAIVSRRLDETMCRIEADEAAERSKAQLQEAQQQRNSLSSTKGGVVTVRSDDNSETQRSGIVDSTDPDRDLSLFVPVVEPETDSSASQLDVDGWPQRGGPDYSLGRLLNNWSKSRAGVNAVASLSDDAKPQSAERLFPYSDARWEYGTFCGKRVRLEATSTVLGRGSLATVVKAFLVVTEVRGETETEIARVPVAVKAMTYDARQKSVRNAVETAVRFRLGVNHPGFVHMFCVDGYYPPFAQLAKTPRVQLHAHATLACSTTGSIAEVLKRTGPFPESEIRRCMAEMLAALQFLHEEHGMVHNDMKPHNILIFEDATTCFSDYRYQLTDFTGVTSALTPRAVMQSVIGNRNDDLALATVGGTAVYMSPESCLGLGMLTSNDIWSLGITAYHMATNTLPWKPLERQFPSIILNGYRCKFSPQTIFGAHSEELRGPPFTAVSSGGTGDPARSDSGLGGSASSESVESAALREKYADFGPILEEFDQGTLSATLKDFVRQCLIENPIDRPSARQLRQHAFVKGFCVSGESDAV